MKRIIINTLDDFQITAHHFQPKTSNNKVILISSAAAIKQQFYYYFAKYLSKKGYDVFTYDFRGIGLSLHGDVIDSDATMVDWAHKDYTALSDYINSNFKNHKKILIGHSFGGSSIGISPNANCFDAYITIASPFGYYKNYSFFDRFIVLWVFRIIMPLVTSILGYFPSKIKQLGEKLPKGVAFNWITLMTHPDSMVALTKSHGSYYNTINKPMFIISFSDDKMAPKKAIDIIPEKLYNNAKIIQLHVKADKNRPIGHINFFKKNFEEDLWKIPCDWIDKL